MDAVEEVKQRLAIEDVLSEYVQLKRAGRNWKGLSPFTNEKSPSFVVSPEKQIWHDFSSGKGGDMFSFVMEVEGLDFKGALEHLARKAGIDLEQFRGKSGRRGPNKERLYAALDAAAHFYQVQFSRHKPALEYVLRKRAFSKETALEWRLGYSPESGSALMTHLTAKGFTIDELRLAGLTSQRQRGVGDMFRGRIMIPLQDGQGRVIGFTARLLVDNPKAPKYINTPQTPLYDKSRHVFGLHLAKEAIRKQGFVVMAEGNLDVIASHQVDVRQVVATAGTALTEDQVKILSRLTGDVRLCFDADRAGIAATERAIPITSKCKVSLSVITIPSGKDPDELIRHDPDSWRQIITQQKYALDWLTERYRNELDITTAEGKRHYSDVLLPVVRGLDDAVERDHYLSAIAAAIGVSREALEQKFARQPNTAAPQKRLKPVAKQSLAKDAVEQQRREDRFLALCLMEPELREYMTYVDPEMFSRQEPQQLVETLLVHPEQASQLQSSDKYGKILSLLYEELYQGLELHELQYEASRLQYRLVEAYVKQQKQMLAAQMADADGSAAEALLLKASQLDELLRLTARSENAQR